MKKMGQRIKEKREELGLTQEELGEKLGVQRQAVNKWERGEVQNIKRSYIQRMSDIFEVPAAWLMGFEDSETTLTYSAPDRETVTVSVDTRPIIGESAKRAALYAAALKVAPQNLDIAINLLESLKDVKE